MAAPLLAQPIDQLRAHVSHYWLGLDNTDETYSVFPDGAVDLVVTVTANSGGVDVFGTSTARTEVPLCTGAHYLGVRFKPGQSRHFLAQPAKELTDAVQPAEGLLRSELLGIADSMTSNDLFPSLDTLLLRRLEAKSPQHSMIDAAIQQIELSRGALRIAQLAAACGASRRQFERLFMTTVGLSAKRFAEITRFQRAMSLITGSTQPLAQIAADLGYSDQSHLTHEFVRFYGLAPSQARTRVAFLQDGGATIDHD